MKAVEWGTDEGALPFLELWTGRTSSFFPTPPLSVVYWDHWLSMSCLIAIYDVLVSDQKYFINYQPAHSMNDIIMYS